MVDASAQVALDASADFAVGAAFCPSPFDVFAGLTIVGHSNSCCLRPDRMVARHGGTLGGLRDKLQRRPTERKRRLRQVKHRGTHVDGFSSVKIKSPRRAPAASP